MSMDTEDDYGDDFIPEDAKGPEVAVATAGAGAGAPVPPPSTAATAGGGAGFSLSLAMPATPAPAGAAAAGGGGPPSAGDSPKRRPTPLHVSYGDSHGSEIMISSHTGAIGESKGIAGGSGGGTPAGGPGTGRAGAGARAGIGGIGGGAASGFDILDASYEITKDGTFKKRGYEINREGLRVASRPGTEEKTDDSSSSSSSSSSRREPDSPGAVQMFSLSSDELVEIGGLGRGSSGVVKKCIHRPTLAIIALKCIDIVDRAKRHQLIKELNTFNSGLSPHRVTFYGAFYDGSCKLALEYMNRGSLQDVIDTYGPLSEGCLASAAKQVLLGLYHLHTAHAVHRDIKPANILVNFRGAVKITDFGVLAELTQTQELCNTFAGTAVYMSPERIQSRPYDYSCDIWSLGMLLVTCALGKFPFKTDKGYFGLAALISEGPPPQLPADRFSAACRSFVDYCLVKDPARRGTVADLLKHPFVFAVDPNVCAAWPFECKGSEKESTDLEQICQVMLRDLYPLGRASYKRSLLDLARFERIAWQLGIPPEEVQKRLESHLTT